MAILSFSADLSNNNSNIKRIGRREPYGKATRWYTYKGMEDGGLAVLFSVNGRDIQVLPFYDHTGVGKDSPKGKALSERLKRLYPEVEVQLEVTEFSKGSKVLQGSAVLHGIVGVSRKVRFSTITKTHAEFYFEGQKIAADFEKHPWLQGFLAKVSPDTWVIGEFLELVQGEKELKARLIDVRSC